MVIFVKIVENLKTNSRFDFEIYNKILRGALGILLSIHVDYNTYTGGNLWNYREIVST